MAGVNLKELPSRIVIESYISGSFGGPKSSGGLDGKGPMVSVDLNRQEIVLVPDFEARLEGWRRAGGENPCPLKRRPTLRTLNEFINHKQGVFYDPNRRLIVRAAN